MMHGESHAVDEAGAVSRSTTRAVFMAPSSPVASARTATVMVCVPALPPIDATIGISTASATMCSMVASNCLITIEARIAVQQIDEQPPEAGRHDLAHAVGDALVADAGQPPQVLVGLLLDHLHHVVDRDDADQALVGVDDRRRFQVVALELPRHRLLVGGRQHHLLDPYP